MWNKLKKIWLETVFVLTFIYGFYGGMYVSCHTPMAEFLTWNLSQWVLSFFFFTVAYLVETALILIVFECIIKPLHVKLRKGNKDNLSSN